MELYVITSKPLTDRSLHPSIVHLIVPRRLGATCIQVNEGDSWQCLPGSAFLVTPQIMISVAHACPWFDSVRPAHKGVTFDEKIISPSKVYEIDQFICDPLFAWDKQDPHDLAVVLLKEPVTNIRPMSLPPILDLLDKGNLATKLTLHLSTAA